MAATTMLEYEYNRLSDKIDEYLDLVTIRPEQPKAAVEYYRLDRLLDYEYANLDWEAGLEKSEKGIFAMILDFFASILKAIQSLFGINAEIEKAARAYEQAMKSFFTTVNSPYKRDINLSGCFAPETLKKIAASQEKVEVAFADMTDATFKYLNGVPAELKAVVTAAGKDKKYTGKYDQKGIKEEYLDLQFKHFSPVAEQAKDIGLEVTENARLVFRKADMPLMEDTKYTPNDVTHINSYADHFNPTSGARMAAQIPVIRKQMESLMESLTTTKEGLINFIKMTNKQTPAASRPDEVAVVNKNEVPKDVRNKVIRDVRQYIFSCMNAVIWDRAMMASAAYRYNVLTRTIGRFKMAQSA